MAEQPKTKIYKNDDTGARFAVQEGSLAHQRMTRAGAGFSEVRSMSGGPEVRRLRRIEDASERRRAEALAEAMAGAFRQGEGTGQSDQDEGQGS